MKKIALDGRIGKDAERRRTEKGKEYIHFSVANNSYSGGKETTEWFEVSCYDPYVVENRVKYLTKGKYVIINGDINTSVTVKNGKIYLNQYITANSIDTPSFGSRKEEEDDTTVSTYTATTETQKETSIPRDPMPSYSGKAPSTTITNVSNTSLSDSSSPEDDLPF